MLIKIKYLSRKANNASYRSQLGEVVQTGDVKSEFPRVCELAKAHTGRQQAFPRYVLSFTQEILRHVENPKRDSPMVHHPKW